MISNVISLCAVVALSSAGVIHTSPYGLALSPLNTYQQELTSNILANPSLPLAAYQSYPLTYSAANIYPNVLPQHYHQYSSNYPYSLAPLHYAPGYEQVALNEPIVYVEPVVHPAPHQIIPEAIVEAQPEVEEKPHYLFAYSVVDSKTGDNKQHQESRDGDVVRGEYSLLESDGTVRRVEYIADPQKGFNAVVSRSKPKEAESTTGSH
ncbi:unnamed protein product [Leptosia nina]|uniref:Cuticle protein n=1 Tax=Leptosia nina TaxID=320188 RepID=A0AAV1JY81_9NEOP